MLVVLVAASFVAAGAVWLFTYDPLAWEDGTSGGPVSSLSWSSVENGVDYPVYYVSATKTGTFNVGFEVTNTGKLPVKVVGLGTPTAFSLVQMGRYSTDDVPGGGHFAGGIVPFEPVTIDPGDSRYVVLQLKTTEASCSPGATMTYSHPPFRYQTLGVISRTATVEAPFRVVGVCSDTPPPNYDPFG